MFTLSPPLPTPNIAVNIFVLVKYLKPPAPPPPPSLTPPEPPPPTIKISQVVSSGNCKLYTVLVLRYVKVKS